jgi:hypothetical protein
MVPAVIRALQAFDTPTGAIRVGFGFVASYYILSFLFIPVNKPGYEGRFKNASWLQKNGIVDWATSLVWLSSAVVLIVSFVDFVLRKKISLGDALRFYMLFIFLFAFVYRLIEWHWPGVLAQKRDGWAAEVTALTLSIGAMTGGDLGLARPTKPLLELIAALQTILGLLFVAIFIAKAVAELPR